MILPTAEILLLGGNGPSPIQIPELLRNDAWILGDAPADSVRDYHSTAVLLPSGKVLTGGGDYRTWDYQIFKPWYITSNFRPTIQTWPTVLNWQSSFTPPSPTYEITVAPFGGQRHVAKVVLIRPGSCTHHFDQSQRYVDLQIVEGGSPTLVRFKGPADQKRAPKGYYMLWVISNENVPSEAKWVRVE